MERVETSQASFFQEVLVNLNMIGLILPFLQTCDLQTMKCVHSSWNKKIRLFFWTKEAKIYHELYKSTENEKQFRDLDEKDKMEINFILVNAFEATRFLKKSVLYDKMTFRVLQVIGKTFPKVVNCIKAFDTLVNFEYYHPTLVERGWEDINRELFLKPEEMLVTISKASFFTSISKQKIARVEKCMTKNRFTPQEVGQAFLGGDYLALWIHIILKCATQRLKLKEGLRKILDTICEQCPEELKNRLLEVNLVNQSNFVDYFENKGKGKIKSFEESDIFEKYLKNDPEFLELKYSIRTFRYKMRKFEEKCVKPK